MLLSQIPLYPLAVASFMVNTHEIVDVATENIIIPKVLQDVVLLMCFFLSN